MPPGPDLSVSPAEPERDASSACEADGEEARQRPDAAALYAAEAPRLWRFFRRRIPCPDEADDLVQETFTRALRQGARSSLRNPGGYLTRIAQNLLRDRAKIARRRSADLHVPADGEIPAAADPLHLLEVRDMLDRLEAVMLELPKTTREIFMAHRLEGLTYAEIARRTGLTIKQVEKAIARAMVELDRALGSR
ncbi:RNA polymerase sigma factor [Stakelama sp. CBK3Z-3]|uniref:RNA polymerase sigma factor n=1 Tax=Stakelama flava TaxID=2860338 RepID=A0ABS6XQ35_9SPHN|nr:RNA polymerase sigma factor [Stakelama flava]MBW4332226.1 RNA polymerase sigma factor [Stakelama flava]